MPWLILQELPENEHTAIEVANLFKKQTKFKTSMSSLTHLLNDMSLRHTAEDIGLHCIFSSINSCFCIIEQLKEKIYIWLNIEKEREYTQPCSTMQCKIHTTLSIQFHASNNWQKDDWNVVEQRAPINHALHDPAYPKPFRGPGLTYTLNTKNR